MSNKLFKIKHLSDKFYADYSIEKFPELELKSERPYVIFVVKISGHTFGIPFRTNIRHRYCYIFRHTGRETESNTGLDFTKAVVIDNEDYIGTNAIVDKKEFNELSRKIFFIKKKFENYYNNYIKYVDNPKDVNLTKKV